ncbi:thiamine phosphate synthase [Deltaproteobacteria bacterium TL4]
MSVEGIYLVGGIRFQQTTDTFLKAVDDALRGGVRIFQLRVKTHLSDREHLALAREVRALTRSYQATFVMNDRPDLAVLCEADGLHLGPEDMSVSDARKIVGRLLIGKSSHSHQQALDALREDIDYLSVGPVWDTDCKSVPDEIVGLELLKTVRSQIQVPLVAIGGITVERVPEVLKTGIRCVGLIRGIMAADNIQVAAQRYTKAFNLSLSPES